MTSTFVDSICTDNKKAARSERLRLHTKLFKTSTAYTRSAHGTNDNKYTRTHRSKRRSVRSRKLEQRMCWI